MKYTAEHCYPAQCQLGEGPIWSPSTKTLYWVDLEQNFLWSMRDGVFNHIKLPVQITALAEINDQQLLVSAKRGLAIWNIHEKTLSPYISQEISPENTRMNDGKMDRHGGFITGSCHIPETDFAGIAFGVKNGKINPISGQYIVWNGPAFSPDGKRIYYADSFTRIIMTAQYDPSTQKITHAEKFAELRGDDGYPDGMTVDSQGNLWNARWDGWGIAVYNPLGKIIHEISLPVPRVTSLVFAGDDLRTIYITTAHSRLSPDQRKNAPLSGDLFTLRTEYIGIADIQYKL